MEWTVATAPPKWQVEQMQLQRHSAISLNRIRRTVRATTDGELYNPMGATVHFAFLPGADDEPVAGDWKLGNWDVTPIRSYVAQCLVGPGGVIALARGQWYVWLRITDATAGETPVFPTGVLIIF